MWTDDFLLFIHGKCLLSTCNLSGTVLDTWDTPVNKTDQDFSWIYVLTIKAPDLLHVQMSSSLGL